MIKNTLYHSKEYLKKSTVTNFHIVFETLPIVVIPLLILINNPTFFIVTSTLLIMFRLYFLCRYFKSIRLELTEKVFSLINIFFWIVLQLSYLILYVIAEVEKNYRFSHQGKSMDKETITKIYSCEKVCGFAIIFAVLLGGIFEVIRFTLKILKSGYWIILKAK